MEAIEEGNWDYGITHNMQEVFVSGQADMLKECTPMNTELEVLPAFDETSVLRRDSGDPTTATPATPSTRARIPKHYWGLMVDIPPRIRRPLAKMEMIDASGRMPLNSSNRGPRPEAGKDYWLFVPSRQELWRVHLQSRRRMFDPLRPIDYEHPQDYVELPPVVIENAIQGVRAIQVRKNKIQPNEDTSEFFLDNIHWYGWNSQIDLQIPWKGITRFQTRLMFAEYPVLHTWLEARSSAENLWRKWNRTMETFATMREYSGWPDESAVREMAERIGMDFVELKLHQCASKDELLDLQRDVATMFSAFVAANQINPPEGHGPWQGLQELIDDPMGTITKVLDVAKPERGRVRLELQWNQLSEAWQRAFEQPILDALEIYFKHDALAPVTPDETIDPLEILPSHFVLVNKADPRNVRPLDKDLEWAKLKARLVVAGHRDQKAGDFETEAPTASLLSHNWLCFWAAQHGWRMWFADISAAFLQGDYLPEERRVFMKPPKNYPLFVREFLASKVPPGARTDLFRMKKGGFGLSESPRLWYKRFKRDVEGIGGKELALAPGVFTFWDAEGDPQAMLAIHVDDVRFICSRNAEVELWPSLKGLFSFGAWQQAADFTRFCGRYEKQLEDGTIIIQMDDYTQRVQEPPTRPSSMVNPTLLPNEKKWIGTICGQLNWMARQCRADLMFGVSRVQ